MSEHKLNNSKILNLDGSDFSGKTLTVKGQKLPGKTIVFAWASYCGHCIHAIPAITQLAKKYNKNRVDAKSITIAAVQGDGKDLQPLNIIQTVTSIKGYPTILIFVNGEFNQQYNGDRSASAIEEYLSKL